jgi:hypothetical protein
MKFFTRTKSEWYTVTNSEGLTIVVQAAPYKIQKLLQEEPDLIIKKGKAKPKKYVSRYYDNAGNIVYKQEFEALSYENARYTTQEILAKYNLYHATLEEVGSGMCEAI